MRWSDLQVGMQARILKLQKGDAVYRQHLMAMGLLPGTEFVVSRIAPLGDPIEIVVRGFHLSLRKAEASLLHIESVAP